MEDPKDSLTFEIGKWKASASGRFAVSALIIFAGLVAFGSVFVGADQFARWSGRPELSSNK